VYAVGLVQVHTFATTSRDIENH